VEKKRKRRRRQRPPSRQPRKDTSAVAEDDARRAATARGKASPGPPPAPWGSFPLSEIVIVVALVLVLAGFFVAPPRGAVMLGTGLVLGSLAGLELAIREHFSGYRSHTLVLAGAIGVVVLVGMLTLTKVHAGICFGAAAVAFGLGAWLFANAFRSRSGGALFRFGSFFSEG
jgi:hypothetical protein